MELVFPGRTLGVRAAIQHLKIDEDWTSQTCVSRSLHQFSESPTQCNLLNSQASCLQHSCQLCSMFPSPGMEQAAALALQHP